MTRSGSISLRLGSVALVLGVLGGQAQAQVSYGAATGTLPGGATIVPNIFYLHEIANSMTNGGVNDAPPLKVPDSFWTYFNFAHCSCDEPATRGFPSADPNVIDPNKHETTYGQQLLLHNRTIAVAVPMQFWSGENCSDLTTRTLNCTHLTGQDITSVDQLNPSGIIPEIHVFDIMNPEPSLHAGGKCTPRPLTANEWLLVSTMNDGNFDYSQNIQIISDGQPPPIPTSLVAESGENAIQLSWSMPVGDLTDIKYFQALCVDMGTGQPGNTPDSSALYQTPRTLCGNAPADPTREISWKVIAGTGDDTQQIAPIVIADAGIDAGTSDAGVVVTGANDPLPAGTSPDIAKLNPAFICKTSSDTTITSLRIDGLQNDHNYEVALLTIDKAGNPAGIYITTPQTPAPVTDFWEGIHQDGSKVQGGFCLLSETYGDDSGLTNLLRAFRDDSLASNVFGRWATKIYYGSVAKLGAYVHGSLALRIVAGVVLLPVVAIALAWHFLTLPGLLALIALVVILRRHRRRILRSRLVGAAVAGAILCIAHGAHADPLRPYWEDEVGQDQQGTALADEPKLSHWQIGVRIGPYTPQIDAQLGKNPGPYAAAFGGYTLMPTIDVDRFLFSNQYGQLGIGLSLGYMRKYAHAFKDGVDVNNPNSPRSPGDKTSFRMIPTAVTATYRFTYLDDQYGIPIVPYARAGLSYYIWWMNNPSGGYARVCTDPNAMEPACMGSSQNVARGASAGLQGSIGFAVRGEKIDANAAASMRDSGLLHIGFYAELQLAKVNGFGSDTKLDVGDTTWFAGINFEF